MVEQYFTVPPKMKNPLHYIHKYPERTRQILGISAEQFEALLKQAEKEAEKIEWEQEQNKKRINKKGGGRPKILSKNEEICLCIFYLRHLPTFEVLGMQFDISKTEANDTFNYWLKIVRKILPSSLIEQSAKNEKELEMVKQMLTEHELIVDSWEQPRERPEDNQEQKKYYSGKKKEHTFKGQVVTLPLGKDIVDLSVGQQGKASDISLFREQQQKFSSDQKFTGDKGYQGGINIKTPQKKPKGKELTESQKEENKIVSSERIYVEHMIRLFKIFRIAKERFRMNGDKYEEIILTVCGLVRLRIGALILPNSLEA
jgi:DDE superfamily endonuclease/Helix-turn-helix of DDE superfamily endonuclease